MSGINLCLELHTKFKKNMVEEQNIGVAFGLVIAAGMCTTIGAAAVFFPALAKLGNRQNLASALGLSAGVMTYISLVDIYQKSITGFEENGHDEEKSFVYATATFFCGCIFMMVRILTVLINCYVFLRVCLISFLSLICGPT